MEIGSPRINKKRDKAASRLSATIIVFFITGFGLIALKPAETFDYRNIVMMFAIPLVLYFNMSLLPRLFPVDRLLMCMVSFLCGLGVLILYSTNTDRGIQQAVYYGVGTVFMLFCLMFVRFVPKWDVLSWLLYLISLALLVLPLVFGREINGAKNWIFFSGISIQPSELVKITLIIVFAYTMSRYQRLSWMVFLGACMVVLMRQKDLGAVLLYFATALVMYYASSGSLRIIAMFVVAGIGASIYGYEKFSHVQKRVAIWLNPWADYENSGYQLIQSLVAIASGGLLGMGLGLGNPSVIPIYYTDFIFSVICEQFGILFGGLVLAIYAILVLRGSFIARSSSTRFHSLLALGCTAMLCIQTFVIIGGVIKFIPLTGVTMPFVSYGGSSLLSSMGLVGVLQGVACYNGDTLQDDIYMSHRDNYI